MPPNKTLAERIAVLETAVPSLQADVSEIKADVKTMLAAHNVEQGAKDEKKRSENRRLATYSTLGGLVGAAGTALAEFFSRH